MTDSNFQLVLTEPNGNYAIPDIIISDNFETSFSIQNAADISKRKDNLSKNITFPGTKNNNRIFNNLFSLNRESNTDLAESLFYNYSPTRGVRAVLYENNYPIITGELKINEVKKDRATGAYTYTGIITGNLVTFFGKIKDTLLTDLPGFDQVVTYDRQSIINTWTFNDFQLFLYPSIDYGKGITPNRSKFDLRNFRPGVYARHYVKEILKSQGYSYKSNFIESDEFKRAFIPFSGAEFGALKFGNFYTLARENKAVSGIGGSDDYKFSIGIFTAQTIDPYIELKEDVSYTIKRDGNPDRVYGGGDSIKFKRFGSTAATFDYSFSVNATDTGYGQSEVGLYQVIGGVINTNSPIDRHQFDQSASNGAVRTGTLRLPYATYSKGDEFVIVYAALGLVRSVTINGNTLVTFGNPDAATGSFFGLEFGDSYNLKDMIPQEQKATDFLKSIFQFFNMYAIENPDNDKELIIEPYNTFYSKALNPAVHAINWTKKVDDGSLHIKINTALPKAYNFKFKEDSDYYNTLYKNTYGKTYGEISVNNKNGSSETKNIEVVFSPGVVVLEAGEDKTMPAIYTGDIFNKKSFKSNLRILYNNGVKACQAYDLVLTYPGSPPSHTVVYAGMTTYQASHHVLNLAGTSTFNLLFGLPEAVYYPADESIFDLPTIYSTMYAAQLEEINSENIFLMELDCHLKENDVARLDLRVPIYISTTQGSAYFKIVDVTYYNSNELSRVVLQKIIL